VKMRLAGIGPRGTLVLALAGVLGVALAVHGWNARHTSPVLGSIGRGGAPSSPAVRATPSPTATSSPGPLLSSQPFAQYAFAIWPGKPGPAAQSAQAGLTINVRRQGTGLSVVAGVTGRQASAPHYYPLGARVYVVEASMGDDSGNSDYNLGDDGVIVTDARGRIVT
jgi:hypothetical protein